MYYQLRPPVAIKVNGFGYESFSHPFKCILVLTLKSILELIIFHKLEDYFPRYLNLSTTLGRKWLTLEHD